MNIVAITTSPIMMKAAMSQSGHGFAGALAGDDTCGDVGGAFLAAGHNGASRYITLMQRLMENEHYWGQQVHEYEEMTPEKRPQDVGRDGSTLTFLTREHHGIEVCPQIIIVVDAQGRRATYRVTQSFGFNDRARDLEGDGSKLRFETAEHGGEFPDDMPQLIQITDPQARVARYRPIREDGKVVDSKGFTFRADSPAAS